MRSILAIIAILLLLYSPASASTYYIDYASGSDANNGTAKLTPWKHAPGMRGCADSCLAKQSAGGDPGDAFILKGGVTWPNDALSWDWLYGAGTKASPIYFGVDRTWYSGASWSRPIIDGESKAISASGEGTKSLFRVYGGVEANFIIDNIEFTGLAQLNNDDPEFPAMLSIVGTDFEVKNCYFHGWSHGGTASTDNLRVLSTGIYTPQNGNDTSSVHHCVFDGSDTTKDMAVAYYGGATHVYNNYISYCRNQIVGNSRYVWGNTLIHANDSFDLTSHGNVIESTGGQLIAYNNFIEDDNGGASIFHTPIDGYVDFCFNNVAINQRVQTVQIDNNGLSTGSGSGIYVFNNTLQSPSSETMNAINGPGREGYPDLPFMTVRNNHLIADNPTVNFGTKVATETESNTLGHTNAQASTAGYVITNTYPYYPFYGGTTINSGYDMASVCSGLTDLSPSLAATACLSDTTLGVTYDNETNTVTGDGRVAVLRGTTWDIGAYEYVPLTSTSHASGSFNLR